MKKNTKLLPKINKSANDISSWRTFLKFASTKLVIKI